MNRTGIAIAAIILLSSASNGWSQTAPYPVKLVRIVNPALPAVATIEEADLAGFHDSPFNGLMAPAGTPREVLERLRDGVAKAVAVTERRNRFLEQGVELVGSGSTGEFAAFLRKRVEKLALFARQAGMRVN